MAGASRLRRTTAGGVVECLRSSTGALGRDHDKLQATLLFGPENAFGKFNTPIR
jgi:hypothetical protein